MSDREVRRLALVASVTEALEVARLGWPDEGRVLAELLTWRNGNRTTIQVHERWRRDRDRGPMMAPRIPPGRCGPCGQLADRLGQRLLSLL